MMKILYRNGIYYLLFFVLCFATYSTAFSQIIFTNNEVLFIANNPDLVFQNFQAGNVPPGDTESCNTPIDENSNDNCFSPGQILPGIQFQNGPVPFDGGVVLAGANVLGNNNPGNVFATEGGNATFEIIFTSDDVMAVGMNVGCLFDFSGLCDTSLEVKVFGSGNNELGDTPLAVTDQYNSFIGIESNEPISKITLSNLGELNFKGIADIRFPVEPVVTNVPTLSEWGLIAMAGVLGIIGMLFMLRRRQAA